MACSVSNLKIPRKRQLLILLALIGATCFCCSSTAQGQTSNEPSFQLKVQSKLVIVRVVVRNAKGESIRGLKKEDFRILDQGKEQSITQFEEDSSDEDSDGLTSAASGHETAPPPTAHRERFVALYFDDLNSSDADLMQARDAADHFFAAGLPPNDHIAIFSAEKMLTDFTADPHQIHSALMQLHASSMGPAREHPCPDLSDYQALEILHTNDPESDAWKVALEESKTCPARSFASSPDGNSRQPDPGSMVAIRMLAQKIVDQSQSLTRASLEQFEKVVKLISKAPGERSVVLASPGFMSQSEQYALDRIIDQALRTQVIINSLDPKGLAILMRESDASKNTSILADPRAAQARYHLDASRAFVGADVLAEFAEGTGGNFFHNDNDLKAGFGALVGDPPHYILAFSPRNEKWDGKFHTLKVSLVTKQKGENVQARRGYFAVENMIGITEQATDAKNPSVPATPTQPNNRTPAKGAPTDVAGVGTTEPAPVNTPPTHPSAASEPKSHEKPDDNAKVSANTKPLHIRKGMNRVTVDQLDQVLHSSHGRPDADLAKQLAEMELIERLDSDRLTHFEADLPGPQSKLALVAQADSSAFLRPPAALAPLPPTPTVDEQIQWLKLAANYATKALSKLPNFFATRNVILFADSPARQELSVYYPYQSLHQIDRSKATVLYREGKQVLDAESTERSQSSSLGLISTGEFGPILGTVLADSSRSSLTWSHWESRAAGPVAVYRFAVPRDKSHYQVKFCCLAQRAGTGAGLFEQICAYHGEITVDPANGNILRIMLQADLKEAYPMTRADLMVEYGPVEIGGKTYICPLHSVAIAMAYAKPRPNKSEIPDPAFFVSSNDRELPVETMINDIAFDKYHVFRTDSRIIPVDGQSPQ